jgi:hypothetical protein
MDYFAKSKIAAEFFARYFLLLITTRAVRKVLALT